MCRLRNPWIPETVNCISCSVVCKIVFCCKFPDIPDNVGKVTRRWRRRRRAQTIAKRMRFTQTEKCEIFCLYYWFYRIYFFVSRFWLVIIHWIVNIFALLYIWPTLNKLKNNSNNMKSTTSLYSIIQQYQVHQILVFGVFIII